MAINARNDTDIGVYADEQKLSLNHHLVGRGAVPGTRLFGDRCRLEIGADPTDNSVLIFLAHNMLELQQMASGIGLDVWSATAKFHELASA